MSAEPVEPPLTGAERAMLDGWLEYHRVTPLLKCDGPAGEQRKCRPVATSLMALDGPVCHGRHLRCPGNGAR